MTLLQMYTIFVTVVDIWKTHTPNDVTKKYIHLSGKFVNCALHRYHIIKIVNIKLCIWQIYTYCVAVQCSTNAFIHIISLYFPGSPEHCLIKTPYTLPAPLGPFSLSYLKPNNTGLGQWNEILHTESFVALVETVLTRPKSMDQSIENESRP